MNYEEMSDFRINKMVSDALGLETVRYPHAADKRSVGVKNSEVHFEWFDYCNNPSDAWPIILANGIAVCPYDLSEESEEYEEMKDMWFAMKELGETQCDHKNPLRAAMIVFLMIQEQAK